MKTAGFGRDEMVLCTKAGYLTPDGGMPADPNEYFFSRVHSAGGTDRKRHRWRRALHDAEIPEKSAGTQLAEHGKWIAWTFFYLHKSGDAAWDIPKADFLERGERGVYISGIGGGGGELQYYGVATWNAFRQEPQAGDAMQLAETGCRSHRKIAGGRQSDSGFRCNCHLTWG